MVFAASTDHVPHIEWSNRMVEEHFRVAFYHLSFQRMPTLMTEQLVMHVNVNLNLFPNSEGISKHFGQQAIPKRENIDFVRYCTFQFGDCVQAGVDEGPKNNNLPRTINCIYLDPTLDMPNSHC